jgi:hypothetical protein
VTCNIGYEDVPAIYSVTTASVIFVRVHTQVTDVYGVKTYKQFVNTLQDNIIQQGAPLTLISDCGQAIVENILSTLFLLE